jgi:hypothetical protein
MDIAEANELITSYLNASPYPTILGLLPLSAEEDKQVTQTTLAELSKWNGIDDVTALSYQLLYGAPAATAYTLIQAASKAIQPDTHNLFWEPFEKSLSIQVPSAERSKLAQILYKCCHNLDVLQPDASNIHNVYVAPFIAQAGIIHAHVEPLAKAIETGVKKYLLPDLEDMGDVRRFSDELADVIHHHPLLKKIILSEAGPILVHKLLVSHAEDNFGQLPHHLREPFRNAFSQAGSGVSLRTPHLTYSHAHGLVLRLPSQASKLLTGSSHWNLLGIQLSAHETLDLPIAQIPAGLEKIELRNLKDFGTRSFSWIAPEENGVFIFNEKTGRQVAFKEGEITSVQPAKYCVVMPNDAVSNDTEYEEKCGSWKLLAGVEIRPGVEPLTIDWLDKSWVLQPELKGSIHRLDDCSDFLFLQDDDRILHYGKTTGLVACLPKSAVSDSEDHKPQACSIIIHYGEGSTKEVGAVLDHDSSKDFDFIDNLEPSLQEVISGLTPGLRELEVVVRSGKQSVKRRFWFWQGLNHFSKSLGFKCDRFPENIATRNLAYHGLMVNGTNLDFVPGFNEPSIRIPLNDHRQLTLRRPGVEMFLLHEGSSQPERLPMGSSLSLAADESRQLIIRSGGYERWEILTKGEMIRTLTPSRPNFQISLSRLAAQFGDSSHFIIRPETGSQASLFTYSSELVTTPLQMQETATEQTWSTQISSQRIGALRVKCYDYTECLSPDPQIQELWQAATSESTVKVDLREGICTSVTLSEALLKLDCSFLSASLTGKFLRIEFEFQEAETEIWSPLECAETVGKSSLTLIYDHPGKDSAWSMLRKYSGQKLKDKLSADHRLWVTKNLSELLQTCSALSSIKYPSIVFAQSAKHLAALSYRLGTCLPQSKHLLSTWYQQGVKELDALTQSSSQIIVRRFLFSSLPLSLSVLEYGPGIDSENASHLVRSMFWAGHIASHGGRVELAKQAFSTSEKLWEELTPAFGSFQNFGAVIGGQEQNFSHFNATKFFTDIQAEIKRLLPKDPDLEDAPILSARHCMLATRQLQRSDRLMRQSELAGADHILNRSFLPLAASHRATETMMRSLNDKVGYRPAPDQISLCPRIGLEDCCPRSMQLADLAWTWALTVRLRAHALITETTYEGLIHALIPSDAGAYNSLNLVLNYSSELFAFYVALIDFAHFKKNH